MNNQSLATSWNSVCEKVKTYPEIDPSQVKAFFPRLQPQAMSDDFLMLTADTAFIKGWIERHYITSIKQALKDLYGSDFTVLIEVDETQSSRPTESTNQGSSSDGSSSVNPVSPQEDSFRGDTHEKPSQNEESLNDAQNNHTSSLTFGNFVIGESNKMAYTMARAVAETPGKQTLNPLFIYGRSGLGKTHLLRAIQNYVRETFPHLKTVYVDSAELLNDYTEAVSANDREKQSYRNFKQRYEEADVLLIDDVQFFQGKKQTLDIVFQIFNKLSQMGKQVVLSADRAPKNIDIDERYQSRFGGGAICDIQPPEIETKLGVIRSFIEEYAASEGLVDFSIPDDVQIYVAENSSSNIRELKSAITKIIYQSEVAGGDMNIEDVRALLEDHFSGGPSKRLIVGDIQKEVETFYKVTHAELTGTKRSRNIMHARQVAIYLSRKILDLPFGEIGKKFNRDHSTIMYSVTNIEEKMKDNRELREEVEALRKMILEE